jgi:hypothetical protein
MYLSKRHHLIIPEHRINLTQQPLCPNFFFASDTLIIPMCEHDPLVENYSEYALHYGVYLEFNGALLLVVGPGIDLVCLHAALERVLLDGEAF